MRILYHCATLLAVFGAVWAIESGNIKWADPTIPNDSNNFYLYTFTHFEPLALIVAALFLFSLRFGFMPSGDTALQLLRWQRLPLMVALAVLVLASFGRFYLHQDFDLSIDEYLNEFEVKIVQQHHLLAPLAPEWAAKHQALKVAFQIYQENGSGSYWASGFLPGFAVLDYLFDSVNLGWALSPLLASLSIVLVASLARRAFPDQDTVFMNLAALLLACSPQFYIMALTKFSWTAHLCGTLCWVWLFTHPHRFLFYLTPILGAMLIGLHQPHVHLLVAFPFLFRLLLTWRWGHLLWFGAWYLAGLCYWSKILILLRPSFHSSGGVVAGAVASLGFPYLASAVVMVFHAITLYAWMTPVLLPFFFFAVITWRKQPPMIQDSLLAVILTFLFYFSFPHLQGHGWGYRYFHSVYGLFVLVAVGGVVAFCQKNRAEPVLRAALSSILFSLLVQIPYRAYEVRSLVRPFALTWNYIASRPVDFVIIQTSEFWYAADLIRNDPWLKDKPLVFNAKYLSEAEKRELSQKGTVLIIGAREVAPFGVILSDPAKKLPNN